MLKDQLCDASRGPEYTLVSVLDTVFATVMAAPPLMDRVMLASRWLSQPFRE
jgi:hypothetical protein